MHLYSQETPLTSAYLTGRDWLWDRLTRASIEIILANPTLPVDVLILCVWEHEETKK